MEIQEINVTAGTTKEQSVRSSLSAKQQPFLQQMDGRNDSSGTFLVRDLRMTRSHLYTSRRGETGTGKHGNARAGMSPTGDARTHDLEPGYGPWCICDFT